MALQMKINVSTFEADIGADNVKEYLTNLKTQMVMFINGPESPGPCIRCLMYHLTIWKRSDPNRPRPLLHPNCYCRVVPHNDQSSLRVYDKGQFLKKEISKMSLKQRELLMGKNVARLHKTGIVRTEDLVSKTKGIVSLDDLSKSKLGIKPKQISKLTDRQLIDLNAAKIGKPPPPPEASPPAVPAKPKPKPPKPTATEAKAKGAIQEKDVGKAKEIVDDWKAGKITSTELAAKSKKIGLTKMKTDVVDSTGKKVGKIDLSLGKKAELEYTAKPTMPKTQVKGVKPQDVKKLKKYFDGWVEGKYDNVQIHNIQQKYGIKNFKDINVIDDSGNLIGKVNVTRTKVQIKYTDEYAENIRKQLRKTENKLKTIDDWELSLNSVEKASINEYTRSYSEMLDFQGRYLDLKTDAQRRAFLSDPYNKSVMKKVNAIEKAIERAPVFEDNAFRGMSFGGYREAQRKYKTFINKINKANVKNEPISLDTMSSFSKEKRLAERFSSSGDNHVIVEVRGGSKTAADISRLSNYPEEQEVLFRSDGKYKVHSVEKKFVELYGHDVDYITIYEVP